MPDSVLNELRSAKILGNTSVAPDGKDLLTAPTSAPPPPPNPLMAANPLAPLGVPAPLAPPTIAPVDVSNATNVVMLANMVTAEEVANEQEMGEILEDTKSECEKNGKVVAIAAAKPGAGGDAALGLSAEAIAQKVYVCFEEIEGAIKCAQDLHGKQFDGRQVTAAFVPMDAFTGLLQLPNYSC